MMITIDHINIYNVRHDINGSRIKAPKPGTDLYKVTLSYAFHALKSNKECSPKDKKELMETRGIAITVQSLNL